MFKTGRYEIVGELGRGSMGVVYEGYDPLIHRRVAIKTMRIEGLSPREYEQYKARFQAEAQAAGILEHPNIVTIHDFGEDSGVLYLAMELLKGKSLREIVDEKGILPVETIIPVFQQVSSALDHAHEHHIIHRDIKPANIMVLDSGLVKVTDFGIAKVLTTDTGMTYAGQILGTPNYMSPEQVKGERVDGRSDIFALGVILYELVTGQKPFGGQNVTTVMYKIINEQPASPLEVDPAIHPGLARVINRALAKRPEDRYQTCRQLADDLTNYKNLAGQAAAGETVVGQRPVLPTAPQEPVRPVESRRFQVVAVIAAVVVAVGLAGGLYLRSRQHRIAPTVSNSPGNAETTTRSPATAPPVTPPNGGSSSAPGQAAPPEQKPDASATKETAVAPLEIKPVTKSVKSAPGAGTHASPGTKKASDVPGSPSRSDNAAAQKEPEPLPPPDRGQPTAIQPTSTQATGGSGASAAAPSNSSAQSSDYVFETDPNGVDVFVDGKLWGRTDKDKPVVATLTVGDHTLVMKYRGVEVLKRQIKKTQDAQWQKWKLPITEPVP